MKIVVLDGRPLAPNVRPGPDWINSGPSSITTSPRPMKCRFARRGAEILVTNKAPIRAPLIATAQSRFDLSR